MESLAQQTFSFLMTILAGGVVGLLFDVYRVLRSCMSSKQLATAMTDLLYWIVVTPTVFSMLLAGNWGELRFYVLIGLAVGLVLYFQALSATVIWLVMGIFRALGQCVGGVVYGTARLCALPALFARTLFRRSPWGRSGLRWGRAPVRPRPARLAMAWQRLSFARLFDRFGG